MNSIIPESEKGQKLSDIIYWGIVALVFLLPLAYSTLVYNTFTVVKATLLLIATFSFLLLWLLKINIEGSFCFKRSPLDLPVLCFAAVAVLSTLFSVNPLLSLFGAHNRNEGLLTILSYVFVYFLATNFINDKKKISHLLQAILFSSVLVSIFGILERFGVDWFSLYLKFVGFTPTGPSLFPRPFPSLGNPAFLGAFLVLVIPVAISFFLNSNEIKGKLLYGSILSLATLALIFTNTRAAWLGFLISIIFYLILVPKKMLWQKRTDLLVFILTSLVVVVLLIIVFYPTASQIITSIGARAVSSVEVGERSVAIRLELWKSSIRLIAKKPILGYGLETFKGVFPPFRSQLLVREIAVADRPHNQLLYLAASMGILGLISFLWIILCHFRVGLHYYRKIDDEKNHLFLLGIRAATFAYLVQEQFLMSLPGVTPIFFAMLALPTCLAAREERQSSSTPNVFLLRMVSIFCIVAILLVMGFSSSLFIADYFYRNGEIARSYHHYLDAITSFQQAISLNPAINEYRRALAESYFAQALDTSDQSWARESIETYREGVRFDPLDKDMWMGLGDMYSYQSSHKEANWAYRKALEVYPRLAPAYWGLGDLYIIQGRYDLAIRNLEKALAITPNHQGVWYSFGVAYEEEGKLDEARRAYQKALDIDPGYEKARQGLERLPNRNP